MNNGRRWRIKGIESGFTLLELLAVVFLLALVAAAAFPSFSGVGGLKVESDARKMASLLRYLNDSALATKERHWLRFDFADHAVSWHGVEGDKKVVFRSISSVNLESRGTVKEGEVTLFFGPMGGEESLDIALSDSEKSMTVSFNRLSGRVKILNKSGANVR